MYFEKLSNDRDFLYQEINNLPLEQINFLIDFYSDKIGPLNILRLTVLKALQNGTQVTEDLVQEVKDKFNSKDLNYFENYLSENAITFINNYTSPRGGNPFQAWSDPFHSLYTFIYYGECKTKVNQYYTEMAQCLISELGLEDYKIDITGFDGPQNQGQTRAWVNIFPNALKNYNNAISYFYEVYQGKLFSGLSKSQKNKTAITVPQEFLSHEYSDIGSILQVLKQARPFANEANDKLILEANNSHLGKEKQIDKHYWMLSAGERARLWEDFQENSIIAVGWDEWDLGSLEQYKTKADIQAKMIEYNPQSSNKNNALCLWQFANEIQIGDIVFIKNTQTNILGRGIVKSQYIYDEERKEYKHIRQVEWTHTGEWETDTKWAIKTLTDITQYTEDVEKLENMFNIEIEEQAEEYDLYSEEDFLNDVFMDKKQYNVLKNLLLNKKNIILQGAPGVGKTFTAKRLCYSILGKKDTSKVEMIQFHQSYGYEDFIMGYRPSSNSFELKYGPFYKFCKKAEEDIDNNYFFIIDEINRGKLSKIFGELLMLIEPDKRGQSLRLLYKDEQFSVPKNLHIIGMMNTADRSIAMIDYALRRRFAFYEFTPAFETDSFRNYKEKFNNAKYSALIDEVVSLNRAISEDSSLGTGFQIGHSYFCPAKDVKVDDEWLNAVVDYEIIPLLKEYWFDEENKIREWTTRLKNAIR